MTVLIEKQVLASATVIVVSVFAFFGFTKEKPECYECEIERADSIILAKKLQKDSLASNVKDTIQVGRKAIKKVVKLENENDSLEVVVEVKDKTIGTLKTNLNQKPKEIIKIVEKEKIRIDTVKIVEKKSFWGRSKKDTIK